MSLAPPPAPRRTPLEALRRHLRGHDGWLIVLALPVGIAAGLLTLMQSGLAHALQVWLFDVEPDMRLSSAAHLALPALLALPLGGLLVGLLSTWAGRGNRHLVDAVEANALHGGRMSMRDNLVVMAQTLGSNGFGASVGLEAAYTQMGAGTGSQLAQALRLRRADTRTLVGAGAAGAIAAAFGAPLAGAFYAFEIVIGAYTPAALAPVAMAALTGAFTAQALGAPAYLLPATSTIALGPRDYALFAAIGLACALVGIGIMRLVTAIEWLALKIRAPRWARPVIGGLLLMPLALLTPQVLSAGHGALHVDLTGQQPLAWIAGLLALKCLASGVSLGFGFRGGLFFASLFMGSLLGALCGGLLNLAAASPVIDPVAAAVAGMAALAAAIVGAPMTMAMLVLEATHDFVLASAVMAAVLVSGTVTRQLFGYSFSTWRLHLRGGTITSPRDVGWVHGLTAGRMMRRGVNTLPTAASVAQARQQFPLGSFTRIVLLDEAGRYAGIVPVARLYAADTAADTRVGHLAGNRDQALHPGEDVLAVLRRFDQTQSDEMAVIDAQGRLLGVLSEAYVRKRYAEELDKRQREMMGERIDDGDNQESDAPPPLAR